MIYSTEKMLDDLRNLAFIAGIFTIISFFLPWFRFNESSQWSYSGLHLGREGIFWSNIVLIGHIFALICIYMAKNRPNFANSSAFIALISAISSIVLISIGISDATTLNGGRNLVSIVWQIGLPVHILSIAGMVLSSIGFWILSMVQKVSE